MPEFRFPDLPELQPQFIESMDAGFTDIHVAILTDETTNRLYAVFRGSDKLIDWFNNAQFRQQIYPYGDGNSEVRFHRGFMAAYCAIPDPLLAVISVAT